MEAKLVPSLPEGPRWQYEPKWDGFRCLAFRDGPDVFLQSKAGQPLARYFPEIVGALGHLRPTRFVLDGEIVVPVHGRLSFDALLMRIHPAESRIRKLAHETPAALIVFDVLFDRDRSLVDLPLTERRKRLEQFAARNLRSRDSAGARIVLSPATRDRRQAERWFRSSGGGLDGIVAK